MHGFDNRGLQVARGRFAETGRFGRLFPELRSQKSFKPGPAKLGAVDGPMNSDAPPGDPSQDNPRIKAGYTFLGQFIDHDLTFDARSQLEQQVDPQATQNFRTPALELDSLYGLGPAVQPFLYDNRRPGRFLIGRDDAGRADTDVQRNVQGRAILGDPRNDENLIVSQLHLLMQRFHNRVYETQTDAGQKNDERFEAAQTLVRWHYQWIVVNEFLPRLLGQATTRRLFDAAPRFPRDCPFMPVEFSVAAYRFGHSQVRPGYALNDDGGAPLFPGDVNAPPGNDLRGGRVVPAQLVIDWRRFFGSGPTAQASKLIDIRISSPLLKLPNGVVPPGSELRSLAARNLQRGIDKRLPSGQDVADFLQIAALTDAQLWAGVPGGEGPGPLWFYCLREAEALAGGQRLAGVGAEIVGWVFAALMRADRASYLVQKPAWTPTLPGAEPGRFTMSDLVNFAEDRQGAARLEHESLAGLPGDDA